MGVRIYALKNGPISVQIEANRKWMQAFSPKRQNELIRNALNMAGQFWADVFLPMRFTNYARGALRYNPSAKWESFKRLAVSIEDPDKKAESPQPTPLMYRGKMRTAALTKWRADSKSTAKRQTLIVRIPLAHAVKPYVVKMIVKVPSLELVRIVETFTKVMKQMIAAESYGPQKKLPKPRQFGPKMAPQFGPKRAPKFGPRLPPGYKKAQVV